MKIHALIRQYNELKYRMEDACFIASKCEQAWRESRKKFDAGEISQEEYQKAKNLFIQKWGLFDKQCKLYYDFIGKDWKENGK